MGDDMARKIEEKRGLPLGWMDTPKNIKDSYDPSGPLDKLAQIMATMEPEMQYKVVRMVAALNEPANGTNGPQH